MTYKGYEIVLEWQKCEVWSLTDDGEPIEFLKDCDYHTEANFSNGNFRLYVIRDDKGQLVHERRDFEQAKEWIDRTA